MRAPLFFTLACLWLSIPASAATYYVNTATGSGSTCSEASPCATVTAGQTAASAGDTVQVTGTITSAITLTKSGTAGNPITYRGHTGTCPTTANTDPWALMLGITTRPAPTTLTGAWTIQASYITVECFNIRPGGNTTNGVEVDGVNRDGVSFIDSRVDGWQASPVTGALGCNSGFEMDNDDVADADTMYAARLYLTGCRRGLQVVATNSLFELLEIYRPRTTAGDMDFTRVWGNGVTLRRLYMHEAAIADCLPDLDCHIDCLQRFSTSDNLAFTNITYDRNICFHSGQGIFVTNDDDAETSSDITITNSLFSRHHNGSLTQNWCMSFENTDNVALYHNACVYAGPIVFQDTSMNGIAKNNIIYLDEAGANAAIAAEEDSPTTATHNIIMKEGVTLTAVNLSGLEDVMENNLVNVDPLLTSLGNATALLDDYRPSSASPAIGAGATGLGIDTDIRNRARDVAPDIGPFEFHVDAPGGARGRFRR